MSSKLFSPNSPGKTEDANDVTMEERYLASMVLSAVGDALGYKNGSWEFCHSGREIHKELEGLGGLESIKCCTPKWMISDDTVMHLATAEALVKQGRNIDKESLYSKIAREYKKCMHDMTGRAPGMTCMNWTRKLQPDRPKGYCIPFNKSGGGCGAAMRAMCIGLRYPRPEDLNDLIAVSVEAGRMTHHHPTGYLGSMAAALFVAYALQGKPVREWGCGLMTTLKKARQYVQEGGEYVDENLKNWGYFTDAWTTYLTNRGILDGSSEPVFPEKYDIEERDDFYRSVSYQGWGGASGHDAPMIAYDALLGSGSSWSELCSRSMFHCGDSDSTGVIAAACYGAMYGFDGVPKRNHEKVEYRKKLEDAAETLYKLGYCQEEAVDSPAPAAERWSASPAPGDSEPLGEDTPSQTLDHHSDSQDTKDSSQSLDHQSDSPGKEVESQDADNQSDSQATEVASPSPSSKSKTQDSDDASDGPKYDNKLTETPV